MANPKWQTKMQHLLDWDEIWNSGVFEVANHESEFNLKKSKMADQIWRTKMIKFSELG